MHDGWKSLIAAAVFIFLLVVVLGGQPTLRKGFTFCHRFDDTFILESLPCFILDIVVLLAAGILFIAAIVLARKLLP